MKLLFCSICGDIVRLTSDRRACRCKRCEGFYSGSVTIEVKGPCLVCGIDNYEFQNALERWALGRDRASFTAFFFVPQAGLARYNAVPESWGPEDDNPDLVFIKRKVLGGL